MSDNNHSYTLDQIEELATKVRERFNIPSSNFVDVTELADSLGYDVYDAEFEVDDIVSTLCDEDDEGEKTIYVNQKLDESEKRFNIANQVAHVVLNHHASLQSNEYLVEYRPRYKGVSDTLQYGEKMQAILLAAAILLPHDLVVSAWGKYKNVDIIAEYFKVPKKLAVVRLDALGLI
ncbi:MAG: ImmA/IrrE family metallo-endopeptidase [Candidatus Dojkabacteria bacterium]|nr:MAG: ImmA/IrrE family metallo-endopeptidase [Candidatus Dojkabacteria bacterium]